MNDKLTEGFAYALGYELTIRPNCFILEGIGMPNIKGKINDGIAHDVRVCFDSIPRDFNNFTPEAILSIAHRLISVAHTAKCVEGMKIDISDIDS